MSRKEIAIIGGGPSAMIAADILSPFHNVTIYEKEKGIGQKFLVAGKGGFNLTNSLSGIELSAQYSPQEFMQNAILTFDSQSLRGWFSDLGVETFVGTSGRVFPIKEIKPSEVLEKIKEKLLSQNVKIKQGYEFVGFDDKRNAIINFEGKSKSILADYYIFALGGASWSITGSDGKWKNYFEDIGINTIPFEASNCGVNIKWNDHIIENHAGKPLKNISVTVGETTRKGESVITNYGLEGNVIYPLVPKIRELLKNKSKAEIAIDFKPDNSSDDLFKKVNNKISSKNYGEIFNLKREQLSIIKNFSTKEEFLSLESFISKIKGLTISVESLRDIEEAISTVGGIDLNELNKDFSLKKYPNIYCIGEMVNWDAPTGGFLLQGAFSMGYSCANTIIQSVTD